MSYDLSERIDDHCRAMFGHSNWGYVSGYNQKELTDPDHPHVLEGGIVFWEKPNEDGYDDGRDLEDED